MKIIGRWPSAFRAITRAIPGVAAIFLAGCNLEATRQSASAAIGSGRALLVSGNAGRWAGSVRPTSSDCGHEAHGLMRVDDGKFSFDPFQSTTIINGTVEGDRLVGALRKPGGGHQVLEITFEGKASSEQAGSEAIEGTLISGRCRWDVKLARA